MTERGGGQTNHMAGREVGLPGAAGLVMSPGSGTSPVPGKGGTSAGLGSALSWCSREVLDNNLPPSENKNTTALLCWQWLPDTITRGLTEVTSSVKQHFFPLGEGISLFDDVLTGRKHKKKEKPQTKPKPLHQICSCCRTA